MHTTPQLIELAKQRLAAKHGLQLPMTDYRLAKLMGLSTQVVSAWKTGARGIGTVFARKFADACDLSPEYVYACIQAERTDNPEEISLLEHIAEAFKGKAAALAMMAIMATGMSFAPAGNQASAANFSGADFIHYANLNGSVKVTQAPVRSIHLKPGRQLRLCVNPKRDQGFAVQDAWELAHTIADDVGELFVLTDAHERNQVVLACDREHFGDAGKLGQLLSQLIDEVGFGFDHDDRVDSTHRRSRT
jgi:hypothetical protein